MKRGSIMEANGHLRTLRPCAIMGYQLELEA